MRNTKSNSGTKIVSKSNKSTNSKADNPIKSNRLNNILIFLIGVFCLFLVLIKGENFWLFLHNIFFGLFSIYAIFVPIIIITSSVILAFNKMTNMFYIKILCWISIIIILSSITQLLSPAAYTSENFFSLISGLYKSGINLVGGGVSSILLGYWLSLIVGNVGSIIILIMLVLVIVVFITDITLKQILLVIIYPFKLIYKGINRLYLHHQELAQTHSADDLPDKKEKRKKNSSNSEEDSFTLDTNTKAEVQKKDISAIVPELPTEEKKEFSVPVVLSKEEDDIIKPNKDSKKDNNTLAAHLEDIVAKAAQETANKSKKSINANKKELLNQASEAINDELTSSMNQSEIDVIEYKLPPLTLLKQSIISDNVDVSAELKNNAELLVDTLKSFGVQTRIVDISRGPTVTRYELQPSAGVKISKITGLSDDIALNLATAGVRIEAPIPNKAAIGIEVPNKLNDIVSIRDIIDSTEFNESNSKLTVALGKDIAGNNILADLAKMPHTLIAGSTGSGKSVCINSIIISLIYKSKPSEVRFVLIDPKVVELGIYNGIPHLLVPVVTDPKKAAGALGWAVTEMLKRYNLFAENSVRDITGYNKIAQDNPELEKMPQIVIIIDELADLMMAAPNEVEDSICRLAQMARAAGMHLVIATQRPSVDVITGVIKANIPSRIAFAVSSQIDSRTILDGAGAEKLLGRGDMLFYPSGKPKPVRVQGCFVTDSEVEEVVSFVSGEKQVYDQTILDEIDKNSIITNKGDGGSGSSGGGDFEDELLPDAVECVLEAGQASTSYIQRKIKVGYARAARLMDEMEELNIVGPPDGSKPRPVLINYAQWQQIKNPDNNTSFDEEDDSGDISNTVDEDIDTNEADKILFLAIECVLEEGQASTTLLQKKLQLGFEKSASILDEMEQLEIIGPFDGSNPRPVLITHEQWNKIKDDI